MTDLLLNIPGTLPPVSFGVSELSVRPLGSVAFLASPPSFLACEPLYDFVAMSLPGGVLVAEIKPGQEVYLHHTELPPSIAMSRHEEKPISELDASGHRRRELEWRRTHGERLRAFSGQWIVLEGEEIIAYGRDPVELVSEARRRGIRVPYIFFVETQTEETVRMGL